MNIIKEGVRGAFIRIIRLITYSIIILIIAYIIGIITSSKASAMVDKGVEFTSFTSGQDEFTGTLSSSGSKQLNSSFTSRISADGYDWLVFNFYELNFISYDSFSIQNPSLYEVPYVFQCTNGINGYCQTATIHGSGSTSSTLSGTVASGELTISAQIWGYRNGSNNHSATLCNFNNNEKRIYCSTADLDEFDKITLYIKNYSLKSIDYSISYYRMKNKYNNDSTDIINGLGSIQQQQTTTNTYIQQQTTYLTDNSTTGSQTQTTNSLNTLSSTFDDTLNGWGGEWSTLTHVILEPINVVLYAFDSNTTCSPIVLNVPYMQNKTIELPCMSTVYNGYFGTFISLFIMIMSGLYCYRTILYVIRTIKEVLDAENDKIEVIDL